MRSSPPRRHARLAATEQERRGFLADVTHELRTPLAVVRGNVEAIVDGVYPADEAHLAPILDATTTLERLVDDLRTVAQAEAGDLELRREPLDVGALVLDAVAGREAEAARRGVLLDSDVPDDLLTVEADPVRVAQVVGNLLANAIRQTPAGGTVTVSVRPDIDMSSVVVTVADTGPGFPSDLLPRAFDRFARGTDSPGAGLGLAIARDLVAAHGGTIEACNLSPGGAEVRFTLPRGGVPLGCGPVGGGIAVEPALSSVDESQVHRRLADDERAGHRRVPGPWRQGESQVPGAAADDDRRQDRQTSRDPAQLQRRWRPPGGHRVSRWRVAASGLVPQPGGEP